MAERKQQLIGYAHMVFGWGWTPLPIKIATKHPYLPKWQLTTKEDALRRFNREVSKGAADGISILTGATSGIVVLDIDDVPYWITLLEGKELEPTFVVQTAGEGLHYYFQYDERMGNLINSNRIWGQKIDFRSNSGVIVFAGNITPDGRSYNVAYPDNINELERPPLARMPIWLYDWILSYQQSIHRR